MSPVPPRHPTRVTRTLRGTGYLLILVAGLPLILHEVFAPYYMMMGGFCVLGGGLSLLGTVTGRWAGEYLGLPLLGSAMLAFAVLTVRDQWPVGGWIAVPSIALLSAYGALIWARWVDTNSVARAAREHAQAETRNVRAETRGRMRRRPHARS